MPMTSTPTPITCSGLEAHSTPCTSAATQMQQCTPRRQNKTRRREEQGETNCRRRWHKWDQTSAVVLNTHLQHCDLLLQAPPNSCPSQSHTAHQPLVGRLHPSLQPGVVLITRQRLGLVLNLICLTLNLTSSSRGAHPKQRLLSCGARQSTQQWAQASRGVNCLGYRRDIPTQEGVHSGTYRCSLSSCFCY